MGVELKKICSELRPRSIWNLHWDQWFLWVCSGVFCTHPAVWTTQTFTSEIKASMVREKVKASEGESDLYSSVSSANIWWETEWWLITSERGWVYRMKRIGPKTEPGGPHKSEVKERILFHSQLLLVSCLAGRNGRRTGQDHEYQKCFRGEFEECYDWLKQSGGHLRHEGELSRYCVLGDKLIGRCAKDCCGQDDRKVSQEQVSQWVWTQRADLKQAWSV